MEGQIEIENIKLQSPWNLTQPKETTPAGDEETPQIEMTSVKEAGAEEESEKTKKKKKKKRKKKKHRTPRNLSHQNTPGYITPSVSYAQFNPQLMSHFGMNPLPPYAYGPTPGGPGPFNAVPPSSMGPFPPVPSGPFPTPSADYGPQIMHEPVHFLPHQHLKRRRHVSESSSQFPVHYPPHKHRKHRRHDSESSSQSSTSSTGTFTTTTTESFVRKKKARMKRSRSGVFKVEESHLYDVDELKSLEEEMSQKLSEHFEMERRASSRMGSPNLQGVGGLEAPTTTPSDSESESSNSIRHKKRSPYKKRMPNMGTYKIDV